MERRGELRWQPPRRRNGAVQKGNGFESGERLENSVGEVEVGGTVGEAERGEVAKGSGAVAWRGVVTRSGNSASVSCGGKAEGFKRGLLARVEGRTGSGCAERVREREEETKRDNSEEWGWGFLGRRHEWVRERDWMGKKERERQENGKWFKWSRKSRDWKVGGLYEVFWLLQRRERRRSERANRSLESCRPFDGYLFWFGPSDGRRRSMWFFEPWIYSEFGFVLLPSFLERRKVKNEECERSEFWTWVGV
jgi:hypothetical protein